VGQRLPCFCVHCHSAKHVRSLNSSTFADKSLVQERSSSCGTFALIRHFKLFHEAILATTFFSKPCEVGCTSATDLHLRSPAATFAALRLRLCCEHCNLLVLHVLISTTQPSRFNTTPYEHWIWSPPLRQWILISKLSLASSSPCSLASTTLVECTLGDSAGMTGNRSTGISDLSNLLLSILDRQIMGASWQSCFDISFNRHTLYAKYTRILL
jgi:hypothetical protein